MLLMHVFKWLIILFIINNANKCEKEGSEEDHYLEYSACGK